MLKLGILDMDSSHAPEFCRRVNHFGDQPDTWVDGAEVIAAVPLPSRVMDEAGIGASAKALAGMGVAILDDVDALAEQVDGLLILSDDGSAHLDRVRRVVDKGLPVFVDKPLEASAAKARELVDLCAEHDCPLLSASSLRFTREMQAFGADADAGPVTSALTYCPYHVGPTVPGLLYYAIHAAEPLFALMGPDCREVRCVQSQRGPAVTATWADGRLGLLRAVSGMQAYGFTAMCENKTIHAEVGIAGIYGELLKQVFTFMQTRTSPVDPDETVRLIAFLEAANRSAEQDGRPVAIG